MKRGKKPIRSSVTAWNTSKPRNIRSTQAKRHKDKMLFCTRKPPETEDNSNESTHYQREHKKDVVKKFCLVLLTSGNKVGKSYSNLYDDLSNKCNKLLEMLQNLRLPVVKPRWYDNSDAGPGVGITNFGVKFRDAELTILYERDYACRLHSARGSSGDNEAERTNSAVGDCIVDGATLQWNKFQKFHNLTDDEISNLTIQDYDSHEETRMEMNAWWVAKELSYRIDGAPVFSEYIHCSVTEKPTDAFSSTTSIQSSFSKQQTALKRKHQVISAS